MSNWKDSVSRRPFLTALGALVGVGIVGGGVVYEASSLWRHHQARTAYDDLLAGISDRDDANVVGNVVLSEAETFEARRIAQDLRKRLGHRPLGALLTEDAVQGRIVETQGWVLPESLALLCGLSAKAA